MRLGRCSAVSNYHIPAKARPDVANCNISIKLRTFFEGDRPTCSLCLKHLHYNEYQEKLKEKLHMQELEKRYPYIIYDQQTYRLVRVGKETVIAERYTGRDAMNNHNWVKASENDTQNLIVKAFYKLLKDEQI